MTNYSTLKWLVDALRADADSRKADGLTACAQLASRTVLTHGVLFRSDSDRSIENVAERYFDLIAAKREFREALAAVKDVDQREAIESAVHSMTLVYDQTYYYFGLASALMLLGAAGPLEPEIAEQKPKQSTRRRKRRPRSPKAR